MTQRLLASLTIPGRPVVLKNSKQIIVVRGRRIIKSNPKVEAYQHRAIESLVRQWGDREPIRVPVSVAIKSFLPMRSDSGNLPDASNLYQCPEDLLQAAGIIEDDRQIEHHDGSRRVCMCDICDERPIYKAGAKRGQRKPSCGNVKGCTKCFVDIEIWEA